MWISLLLRASGNAAPGPAWPLQLAVPAGSLEPRLRGCREGCLGPGFGSLCSLTHPAHQPECSVTAPKAVMSLEEPQLCPKSTLVSLAVGLPSKFRKSYEHKL